MKWASISGKRHQHAAMIDHGQEGAYGDTAEHPPLVIYALPYRLRAKGLRAVTDPGQDSVRHQRNANGQDEQAGNSHTVFLIRANCEAVSRLAVGGAGRKSRARNYRNHKYWIHYNIIKACVLSTAFMVKPPQSLSRRPVNGCNKKPGRYGRRVSGLPCLSASDTPSSGLESSGGTSHSALLVSK